MKLGDLDWRDPAAIASGPHLVAHLPGYTRVVRAVDGYWPAPFGTVAEVWVDGPSPMDGVCTAMVPVRRIEIRGVAA